MNKEKLIFSFFLVVIFFSSTAVLVIIGENRRMTEIIDFEGELHLDVKGAPIRTSSYDGQMIDLRGKSSLLVFFKTTCPGCEQDFPILQSMVDTLQNAGVSIVGITYENISLIKDFVKKYQISFPIIKDKKKVIISNYKNKIYMNLVYINSNGLIKYSRYLYNEKSIVKALMDIICIHYREET